MNTHTMLKATITTECTCEVYVETEPDGTHLTTQPDFCMGCDEANHYWAQEVIDVWLSRQTIQSNRVRIHSPNMGWERLEAWKTTDVTNLIESLRLNGDYRIIFTLNDTDLLATRYSHDEPTGASFVFNLVTEENDI
jgi:hypothetical protein